MTSQSSGRSPWTRVLFVVVGLLVGVVVVDLVVVPHHQPWERGVRRAKRGIATVLRVAIAIVVDGRQLTATVEDDGRAFDAECALSSGRSRGSLGLIGMQERASLAGGWLRIDAKPGRGTLVSAGFAIEAAAPGIG